MAAGGVTPAELSLDLVSKCPFADWEGQRFTARNDYFRIAAGNKAVFKLAFVAAACPVVKKGRSA